MKCLVRGCTARKRERWDWKPGSGFKACTFNSYNMMLPERQVPSQLLPGPWVPFPRLRTQPGQEGNWPADLLPLGLQTPPEQLPTSTSSAQPQPQAGGEKEWGGKKG